MPVKQENLKDFFGGKIGVKSKAWGDLQDKFWNDPRYAKYKERYLELLELHPTDYDWMTTIMPMKHKQSDEGRQEIVNTSSSKKLMIDTTGMEKGSAYNVRGFQKEVIVDGANIRVSSFPKDITKIYVYFFTNKGDTVLDPFSGHNSRMSAVVETKRNYIGYDICEPYVNVINEAYEKYKLMGVPVGNLTMHFESSENIMEEDNSVDFIFTSPPFWNVEYYNDDPRQLGGRLSHKGERTYEEFLEGYQRVINQCARVLKSGHYIGFNVEDIHRDGKLILFSMDTIKAFQNAGLTISDIVITPYTSSAKMFQIPKILNSHFGKTHGYIIFARKGDKLKPGEITEGEEEEIEEIEDEENDR